MPVYAARAVAEDISAIQKTEVVLKILVSRSRDRAIKTIEQSLWRRYKVRQKREQFETGYVEWLYQRRLLERTFLGTLHGTGPAVRRRNALNYTKHLRRKEVSQGDDTWFFGPLADAINRREPDPDWVILVDMEFLEARENLKVQEGVSVFFHRRRRPAPED